MNIAIIGRSELLYESAKLISKYHTIKLIITSKESPEYAITSADFKKLAISLGAKFLKTTKLEKAEISPLVIKNNIQIGISVNYNVIIKQEIIDLFKLGILNAHGGDLPRYRGNACQAWAILNGEKKIGLCIHKMVGNKVDYGDIISREYLKINLKTKINDVYNWMNNVIPELFVNSINKLESNPYYFLEKQSENPQHSLRCYPRKPEDARINWNLMDIEIIRLINASGKPYDGAFCYLNNTKVYVLDAELFNDEEVFLAIPGQILKVVDKGIIVSTGNNKKILIKKIRYLNNEIPPIGIIKSLRTRLN